MIAGVLFHRPGPINGVRYRLEKTAMRPTLKQIAQKTGLSVPTVHKIINNYDHAFTDATRQKVLAAAAELDYRPNIAARSLVTQRSFLIGILFYMANQDVIAPFIRSMQASVTSNRCSPVFYTHNGTIEEAVNLRNALDRRVDGLIVNAAIDPDGATNIERFKEVRASGMPMVEVFGRYVPGIPKFIVDHRATARAMTQRLINDGHKRIALLISDRFTESDDKEVSTRIWTETEFWQGYLAVMKSARLQPRVCKYALEHRVSAPDAHFMGATEGVKTLFKNPKTAPTGIVACAGEGAEAALRYFSHHLEDQTDSRLSIAVSGDLRPSTSPRLQLICFPASIDLLGRSAGDALFRLIAGETVEGSSLGPLEPRVLA
jgi:DNA-binding LacI/PurR family transcriptional regulator